MCGIAAIIFTEPRPADNVIERMSGRLAHRGPDALRVIRLDGCHLGHTRLSVIDLAGGHQPMSDETERYWIELNGEIFNYRELRARLEKHGWPFRTQSDTEVLLRAYQQFGEKVVDHLNGQFAFLIWDQTERKLFAARDRMGEKPLYWARSAQGHLLFASEIKALLASKLFQPRIDPLSVDAYLGLLYVPPDRTIYENVFVLRPGHALRWLDGRLNQWPYWQPTYSQREIGDPQAVVEQLRFLISQAVRRQMVADVPVGAFLSGGLDSSTVVAMMAENTRQPVSTFSVGFGDLINELPYARAVANAYRTQHHEIQMDIPVGEMLERMAEVYDEPFGDSSNIPTYLIAQFARQHVKVVLAGDGADEIFGGYDWYEVLFDDAEGDPGAIESAKLGLRSLFWRSVKKLGLKPSFSGSGAMHDFYRMQLRQRYPDIWERHLARITMVKQQRARLPDGKDSGETNGSLRAIYKPGEEVTGLDRATDFDVRCYLPGDILVKVDRAAMAHGLETRAPFLDVDLVEFVLSLPSRLRFKHNTLKYLLRESCRDLWPPSLHGRPKQGFQAPISHWLKRGDVQALKQRVCSPKHPLATILPGIGSIGNRHPQFCWTVLCLGLWLERRTSCLRHL